MIERCLIEHCAPTLASLKTANLFSMPVSSEDDLYRQVAAYDLTLSSKGVSVCVLQVRRQRALIYVYRRKQLEADLQRADVKAFLAQFGYREANIETALPQLKARLRECDKFPHEIGVFLSYPLDDVIAFIQNAGHGSKFAGCWKAYSHESEAAKTFLQYKRCRETYRRLWQQGKSVWQLTVAAQQIHEKRY